MQISLEKAVDGFIGFMADQVATIPKMSDRFLGFAALGALKSNPGALVNKVKPLSIWRLPTFRKCLISVSRSPVTTFRRCLRRCEASRRLRNERQNEGGPGADRKDALPSS